MWDEDLRDDSGMTHLLIYLFFSSKKWVPIFGWELKIVEGGDWIN
jgi:hypothetical protein